MKIVMILLGLCLTLQMGLISKSEANTRDNIDACGGQACVMRALLQKMNRMSDRRDLGGVNVQNKMQKVRRQCVRPYNNGNSTQLEMSKCFGRILNRTINKSLKWEYGQEGTSQLINNASRTVMVYFSLVDKMELIALRESGQSIGPSDIKVEMRQNCGAYRPRRGGNSVMFTKCLSKGVVKALNKTFGRRRGGPPQPAPKVACGCQLYRYSDYDWDVKLMKKDLQGRWEYTEFKWAAGDSSYGRDDEANCIHKIMEMNECSFTKYPHATELPRNLQTPNDLGYVNW